MNSTLLIEMTDHGQGKVFLDDRQLDNVVAFTIHGAVGELNIVTLQLLVSQVSYQGLTHVGYGKAIDITTFSDKARRYAQMYKSFYKDSGIGSYCDYNARH